MRRPRGPAPARWGGTTPRLGGSPSARRRAPRRRRAPLYMAHHGYALRRRVTVRVSARALPNCTVTNSRPAPAVPRKNIRLVKRPWASARAWRCMIVAQGAGGACRRPLLAECDASCNDQRTKLCGAVRTPTMTRPWRTVATVTTREEVAVTGAVPVSATMAVGVTVAVRMGATVAMAVAVAVAVGMVVAGAVLVAWPSACRARAWTRLACPWLCSSRSVRP